MFCSKCGVDIPPNGSHTLHMVYCNGPAEEPTPKTHDKTQTEHPGLRGAQKQACGMFEIVRGLERVRMRARDAGDASIVEKLSKQISEARNLGDLFIDREHNPHAGPSHYAPDDAEDV